MLIDLSRPVNPDDPSSGFTSYIDLDYVDVFIPALRDILVGVEHIDGSGYDDRIVCGGQANRLRGRGGNDSLNGAARNDTLDGGAGTDTLVGGLGNDTYVLASSVGAVVELAGAGMDAVRAAVSHVLAAQVENLVLTGTAALSGAGNGLANVLIGNAGANTLQGGEGHDRLDGGAGLDRLEGGTGNDTFQFTSVAQAGDAIADFANLSGNNDLIRISAAGFGGGLVAGTVLSASQFRIRADNLAQDADDRFVFRPSDTTLWFDSNGNASGGLSLVADLQAGATMSAADIWLY